jgi:predicted GIY-YIG superfamily endonuclease
MGELYRLDFANGKSYIGITTRSARERFNGHRSRCRSNKGGDAALYHAWRKHGEPKLVVLAVVEDRDLPETEVRAIKAFSTLVPNGYNVTEGGDTSPMVLPEIAAKVSATKSGVSLSEGHKASLSAAQRGKPRPGLSVALTGKKASDETRAKMSASAKAHKKSPEHIAKLRISAEKARTAAKLKKESGK